MAKNQENINENVVIEDKTNENEKIVALEEKLKAMEEEKEANAKKIEELEAKFNEIEAIKVETENGTSTIDIVTDSEKTRDELKKLPKILVSVPRSELNPEDKFVDVAINGYTYRIERGIDVELPSEVVRLLKVAKYI